MSNKWSETLNTTHQNVSGLFAMNKELSKVAASLDQAMNATNALDPKTKELIAIAVAVTTRCEGCIASHVKDAIKHGATEAELAETFATAIALNAGAALVYSAKAADAFKELSK